VGGSGADLGRTQVVRIGRQVNGQFDPLTSLGGSVLQRRSIKELDPHCPIVGERVPPEANVVSLRATPPVFGFGLIEAIPEASITPLADPNDLNRDGISGVANRVFNPETGRQELGRFGWKAQVPTLHLFSGEAYLNEMGITNPSFPTENLPQGRSIPAGWDRAADPEDVAGVEELTNFMKYLAAPQKRAATPNSTRGEGLFTSAGCAKCHTPSLRTSSPESALNNQIAFLYSDLLLHDMGPALEDRVPQGLANGREWRTTPLWGTAQRPNWLHDGRARSLEQAIQLHDGEGRASADQFRRMNPQDRGALLEFLRSL
jgi:CxxC motif-containing protein (DUF1111 family)